jgi:hypothetical protein
LRRSRYHAVSRSLSFRCVSVFETVLVLGPVIARLLGKPERGEWSSTIGQGILVVALVLLWEAVVSNPRSGKGIHLWSFSRFIWGGFLSVAKTTARFVNPVCGDRHGA